MFKQRFDIVQYINAYRCLFLASVLVFRFYYFFITCFRSYVDASEKYYGYFKCSWFRYFYCVRVLTSCEAYLQYWIIQRT